MNYNVVAKRLDRRLSALGSQEILPRGLGDDQHPFGYEAALDPWLQELWTRLRPSVSMQLAASIADEVCHSLLIGPQASESDPSAEKPSIYYNN